MEDIAFNDWPSQSVDLTGSNPWLPAYGFQQPTFEKEDFLNSSDAAVFLNGGNNGNMHQYVFLETIMEETSDDLLSTDSERSGSRCSHDDINNRLGWLATDSESGSVIRVNITSLDDNEALVDSDCSDDDDSTSECDIVCPAKRRRRHDCPLLLHINTCDDDIASLPSLSRSSSLLQFETLEKRCQEDVYNSSPSILSTFSYDSLENTRPTRAHLSPDSLNKISSDSADDSAEDSYKSDCDYYRTIKIDGKKKKRGRDSLSYKIKAFKTSDSEQSSLEYETPSSDEKVSSSLKTFRSFESLQTNTNSTNKKEKMSAENLSEDSGYCDQFVLKHKSSSNPNFQLQEIRTKRCTGFTAYDGESHLQTNTASHFGTSYHDLSIFDPHRINEQFKNNLQRLGRYEKNKQNRLRIDEEEVSELHELERQTQSLKLELASSIKWPTASKYNNEMLSASEPNLLTVDHVSSNNIAASSGEIIVSSVPQHLNLAGSEEANQRWQPSASIAIKNIDLADLISSQSNNKMDCDDNTIRIHLKSSDDDLMTSNSKNRTIVGVEHVVDSDSFNTNDGVTKLLDVTDDNRCYNLDIHSDIMDFETNLEKAISNSSIPSFKDKTDFFFHSTPIQYLSRNENVQSTPNLTNFRTYETVALKQNDTDSHMKRLSGSEGKNVGGILLQRNSLTGSGSTTKGVHFCEIVSEVSWREMSYSEDDDDNEKSNSNSLEDDLCDAMEEVDSDDTKDNLTQIMIKIADHIEHDNDNLKRNQLLGTPPDHMMLKKIEEPKCNNTGKAVEAEVDRTVKQATIRLETSQEKKNINRSRGATLYTNTNVNHTDIDSSCKQMSVDVMASKQISDQQQQSVVVVVDNNQQTSSKQKHHSSNKSSVNKLSGFLSRFTNFRFSTRNKNRDKKKVTNFTDQQQIPVDSKAPKNNNTVTTTAGMQNNPDYVYIPLKDPNSPVENSSNCSVLQISEHVHNNQIRSKPPLPKLPPRVIGASVKARGVSTHTPAHYGGGALIQQQPRIDSGNVSSKKSGVVVTTYQSNDHNNTTTIDNFHRRHATIASGCGVGTSVDPQSGQFRHYQMEHQPPPPLGLIETDLDTHITVVNRIGDSGSNGGKARSLMNLGGVDSTSGITTTDQRQHLLGASELSTHRQDTVRPHKSMEFLLDKQNLKVVEPPENELQKGTGERVMSEHQLRVQRSLQKLNVPDWFKQSQVPREGFLLKKQRDSKWSGLTGKTTSLSSLGGSRQSPVLLSPSPQSTCTGPIGNFTRWSTSKLNSTASSPCNSARSSFNYRQPIGTTFSHINGGATSPCSSTRSSFNYRQPYLGWRSQERLAKPRTPAERLATSLLTPTTTAANSEIQSSIKEVTSAIVHYVSGLTPPEPNPHDSLNILYGRGDVSISPRLRGDGDTSSQRSVSPASRGSQKLCWLESSFVGTRPLDSPQTPIGIPTDATSDVSSGEAYARGTHYPSLHLDLKTKNSVNSNGELTLA